MGTPGQTRAGTEDLESRAVGGRECDRRITTREFGVGGGSYERKVCTGAERDGESPETVSLEGLVGWNSSQGVMRTG